MKYLGMDYVGGFTSIGVFDSQKKDFTLKEFNYISRTLSWLYFEKYAKNPNKINHFFLKHLVKYYLKKLFKFDVTDAKHLTISDYSGTPAFLDNTPFVLKHFKNLPVLRSDHFWGHINAVKLHKNFKYPALVIDSSATHSMVAYIPDKKSIKILHESQIPYKGSFDGLGKVSVHLWVDRLKEKIFWSGESSRGRKNVYELYTERGINGKIVLDMTEYIKKSKYPLAEDVVRDIFPMKMDELHSNYNSEEEFRNDWVASQMKMLRDIANNVKLRDSKGLKINSYFISGGISRNYAFKDFRGWNLVPDIVAGDDGAGCFMAYLGYCVKEEGLKIKHDKWKNFKYYR